LSQFAQVISAPFNDFKEMTPFVVIALSQMYLAGMFLDLGYVSQD
jgi:hypothetical protein